MLGLTQTATLGLVTQACNKVITLRVSHSENYLVPDPAAGS